MPFRERRVTSWDDLSLYTRDYGDSRNRQTPLLCLSGLTRNSNDFANFAEQVSTAGRRVICFDYRGCGESARARTWRDYNLPNYLRDIHDILVALDIHRVAVVGTSVGGLLGTAMASAMPSKLAAVVLNDIGPEIERKGLGHIVSYVGKNPQPENWEDAILETRKMFPTLKLATDEDWYKLTLTTFRQAENGDLRVNWDIALAKPLRNNPITADVLWQHYRALRGIPVLLLRGVHSDILGPRTVDRMVEKKPDLIYREITDAGHALTLAEPESREALDEFFSRL